MGNYFTRRARFGKTVEAAGRTLIGKQGEDLFFLEITVRIIFGDHGLSLKITVFLFQFCTVEAYCLKITASMISKGKIRSSAKFTVRI